MEQQNGHRNIKRQLKSGHMYKILKASSERNLKYVPAPSNQSIFFDDNKISEQVLMELDAIKAVIRNYQHKLAEQTSHRKEISSRQQLVNMERVILSKDQEIHHINDQIKNLKSTRFKQDKSEEKKKIDNGAQMFKLAEQLRVQKIDLITLINDHADQINRLVKLRAAIHKLEQKHIEKCKLVKEKPITYEEFKERYEEAEMKEDGIQYKKKKNFRTVSIKDRIIENNLENHLKPQQTSNNSMKDLQNKKYIAQTALKNSKKKHNTEINELNAKLQFLRDEDISLAQKLKQKQLQKNMLQHKFNKNIKQKLRGSLKYLSAKQVINQNQYH